MSFTSCVRKAGKAFRAEDKAAVMDAARGFRADGMTATAAAVKALRAQLKAVQASMKAASEPGVLNQAPRAAPKIEVTHTAEGFPEFRGNGVAISYPQPTARMEVIEGPGQKVVNYAIMAEHGFDVLGYVDLLIEDGKPTSLLDIEISGKNKGAGRRTVEALLAANPNAELNISNIVPEARGFWEKMGIPQQNVEGAYDGTITHASYTESLPQNSSGAGGRARTGEAAGQGRAWQETLAQPARGTYSPTTKTITLLKGANLSTALHEFGHAFLDIQAQIAAQPNAPAAIAADMNTLLDWFGVKAEPDADALTVWHRMTLDEQRESHEKFARGFEAYLFSGKAPNVELQGAFQRFRAWLLNVYQSLKSLNVTLTPDVRGVMDRMLATEQEIETAEAAASMGMLFKTPEEAQKFGLAWSAYQALGVGATETAIDQLGARSLKDMQWLTNAKGRVLKALQKDAAEKRKEVRREVAGQVMAQPVYQAWQALTGKAPGALEKSEAEIASVEARAEWKQQRADAEAEALKAEREAMGATHPDLNGIQKGQFLAKNKRQIGINVQQRMLEWEQANPQPEFVPTPAQEVEPGLIGKLDAETVKNLHPADYEALKARKMVAAEGAMPDVAAEVYGFGSGDEMVHALATAPTPHEAIEAATDAAMLQRYGDISSPEAMEAAANEAIHNDMRQKVLASELAALEAAANPREATGKTIRMKMPDGSVRMVQQTVATLPKAAKAFAEQLIARLKVRDIRPAQYSAAQARAGKAAEKALAANDIAAAAEQKRNQLVNGFATKAAADALAETQAIRRYFKKFASDTVRRAITADYADRIEALLEKFDLSNRSGRAMDKDASLRAWVQSRLNAGEVPDVAETLLTPAERAAYVRELSSTDEAGELVYKDDEARATLLAGHIDASAKRNWREMTVEELRGLHDTVKNIEHLGRLKGKMLSGKEERAYEAVRDEVAAAIVDNAANKGKNTPTATDWLGRKWQGIKQFGASHIKVATWAFIMDGGKDAGPVWQALVRPANERASFETDRRAELTAKLDAIMRPVLKGVSALEKIGPGKMFPSVGRSLNWQERFTMALNTGNVSNLQRLLGGNKWTLDQIKPVLDTLTAAEWQAVQSVWNTFEEFRPEIAALESKLNGKEPTWIEPAPVVTKFGTLKGGYYPVKFDPRVNLTAQQQQAAQDAKEMMSAARSAASTRRGFVKDRVEEVHGRPLLLSLSGMYSGFNDVIHDLAWREWLIDANKLLNSKTVDAAVREHYGPEVKREFEKWRDDLAAGTRTLDHQVEKAAAWARQGVSMSGLAFNVMSAAMQPLGIVQSGARVGWTWVAKGMTHYVSGPIDATRGANEKSSFMASRARTRFRELNELRNQVQGQTAAREVMGRYSYWLLMRVQQMVDVPTWWAGYEKGIAEGHDEDTAIALADQGVKDSQGGGEEVDQSGIERGGPLVKLFTVFYNFMNTQANVLYGNAKTEKNKAKVAANMLLIAVVVPVLGKLLRDALTPGDTGDDDEKLRKKLAAAAASNLIGMVAFGRELDQATQALFGEGFGYSGPAGMRVFPDAFKLAQQAHQGEFDDAFRKASINLAGDLLGLPGAQINRTITGAQALGEGKTSNPAALALGYQEPR